MSAEGTPSESKNTGLNDMTVLAEKTGKQVTIEGNRVLNPTDISAVRLYYPETGQPPTNKSGVLYVHDNSITVSHRTAPIDYSSITGVEVAPSFAPSADGSVKGIVRIENNETTVKNSNLPDATVYAVHDLTDNRNGRDSSSLMAANNRLTISDSTVGEVVHVTLEGPYINSRNIIQKNVTDVVNSTVKGGLYGTLQHYSRPFGSLERLDNTICITKSTVGADKYGFMGSFTNGAANSFIAKNNKLTFSDSTSNGIYSIQDYVYGTTGNFQNNTLRLEKGAKAYVVVGENFVNNDKNDTSSSSIMNNNEVILTGGSTAGYISTVESNDTNEASQASGNKLIVSDGSTLRFGAAAITTGTAENNRINLESSTAQVLIAAKATGSGSVNNNIVSLSGEANLVSADDLKALDGNQISYGDGGFDSSPVVIAGFTNQGTASNNEVWVAGDTDLSQADVYGALRSDGTKPEGSGNAFRVGYENGTASNWNEPKVQGLYHFDKIAFYDLNPQQAGLVITNTLNLPKTVELEMGKRP